MGICQFEKDKYNSKICCEENKRKKRKKGNTHRETNSTNNKKNTNEQNVDEENKISYNDKIINNEIKNEIKNEIDINKVNSTKETIFPLEVEENVPFPPGEHIYQLIRDTNISNIIENPDNLSERIELFFSLNNIKEPKKYYSFHISIINNKKTGIETHLLKLEEGTGEH